jgi:antitoxin (DNA-binding transcriptional repressor) of toxin-antitoxin stability system
VNIKLGFWYQLGQWMAAGSVAPIPEGYQLSANAAAVLRSVQEVEQGQDVVIARSGVPIARLVAWQAPPQQVAAPGAMRGQITLADAFDAPLDGLVEALQ